MEEPELTQRANGTMKLFARASVAGFSYLRLSA
jgi:hypothetical protein